MSLALKKSGLTSPVGSGISEALFGPTDVVPPGPVYDQDATALFARFATQPDATRKQLISDRFVAGKAMSFWPKLDALWVHAAHGPEAARINWLGDIYNCLPVNNPDFTIDRGYMGDGTSSYLNTQFNPATAVGAKHVQNSGSFGIRSNTDNQGTGSLAGFYDGTTGTSLQPRATNNAASARIHSAAPGSGGTSATTAIGMFVASRNSATVIRIFRNAVLYSNVASGVASTPPANGNYRLGSITDTSLRACQFSMGFIGSGFTDQEVLDIYNWFEPYRIALGIT